MRKLTLLVVVGSVIGTVFAAGAVATDPPSPLQYACAAKSNGLMRAATSPSQCNSKKETVVTFSVDAPVTICLKQDVSVRLGACTKSGPGSTRSVPSNTPTYFCADMASTAKTLKWVIDPANCPAGTTAFVVVNHAPTDIALSNSSVAENEPVGAAVGALSATDPDAGDSFTFSLAPGAGDADNASFQIDGSTLETSAVFDYETKSSYSVRVRVTDSLGLTYEEAFTINVTDVVENAAPTDIQLSNSTVAENQPAGTNVGTLVTTDPEVGDTHAYSLVAGVGDDDNAKFQISGSTLQTSQALDFEADSSLSVRIRTFDGSSGYEESFTITVTNANDPPSDVALSNSSVAENQPAGTNVGSLSAPDQDAGATHTFALVAGSGDEDNARFQISGSVLQTAQSPDFEADSSLSVRVRADDGAGGTFEKSLTITVTNVNEAPTDIALSNSSVAENEPVGTTVGTFSATDLDAGDTHTFALVTGSGDTDNASFQIDGSTLKTNAIFDLETKSSYSIRVRATDAGSLTLEEPFTITITNVNEPPVDINLSNSSIAEDQPAGTAVGTLTTVDDPGSTHTYTLVAGAGDTDNASFQIDGDALESAAVFDFETKSSYSIRIRTDDGGAGTVEEQFTITITDVAENQAPTDIALSNSNVAENQLVGAAVGTLSATDPDPGDTHTFALVAGAGDTDNGSFQIDGTTLETNAVFDFEADSSYSLRVRVTDSASNTFEESLVITVTNANDAPTDTALSNASVNENQGAGTGVGTLSATDQDAGDSHAFTLVAGAGDTDNASFQIDGTILKTNAAFNFEVKNSYSIRVRVTDNGAATFEEQFTITIVDVNDAPVAVADSYGNAVGNTLAVLSTSGSGPHVVLTGNVVINNDTDEDTTFPDTITAVAETVSSTGGGSATINADGSFTFLPGVGDKNLVDAFTYRVTDGSLESAGTVSVTIANVLVWYVDASAGARDGRSSSPLNTLSAISGPGGAGDADATGDIIFLYSGTYGGGLPLEASQKLLGQPHGLTVDPGSGDVTLVPAGGTNPIINNANAGGDGVTLANGVDVQRIDVTSAVDAGIVGTNITTATIGTSAGDCTLSGANGAEFQLTGNGSGNINVFCNVTTTAGRAVDIQNRTGGAVNLSGTISDPAGGTGQGILVNSNTGATIAFTGDIDLDTATNAAFTATGGGTVTSTNTGSTLVTTTGTALNVSNTTIGAADLTFVSISANGATNGIVLNNTGASGNLLVTGNGGTCTSAASCTGGAIQNTTTGISLTSTMSPTFDQVGIFNSSSDGVGGTDVTNLTFTDGRIDNSGTGGGVDTSNIGFNNTAAGNENNLDGVVTITGNTLTNARYQGIDIFNFGGLISDMNVSNNTITSSSSVVSSFGSGIRIIARGSAGGAADITKAAINNNVINNFPSGVGLQVQCGNANSEVAPAADCGSAGSATNVVNINGNKINGSGLGSTVKTGAEGMIALVNGVGQGNFTINNNEVRNTTGTSISHSAFGDAFVTSTINSNTIVSDNTVGSQGIGAGTSTAGGFVTNTPSMTLTIQSNNISDTDGNGILVVARDAEAGTVRAKILNNVVGAPQAGVRQGIRVDAGNATGDNDVCLQISGNTSTHSVGQPAALGIGLRKQGTSTTVNAFGIVGLAPSPATGPQVIAYVNGQNPTGGGTLLISSQDGFIACPPF